MLNIVTPYNYYDLKREDHQGKRWYLSPDGKRLPSVTTILDKTANKTHLIEWRKRIGEEKAKQQTTQAANAGSIMHKELENFILGNERTSKGNLIYQLGKSMADRIINNGLSNVNEVWGIETKLYFPEIYAGTADLIGVYNNEPAIIDFKNSKRIKKLEWIEDYFLQGCAYGLAHNELFNTNIQKVVILMASREDQKFQEFIIEGIQFKDYCDKWISRLEQYFNTL